MQKNSISSILKNRYFIFGLVALLVIAFALFFLPYLPIGFECSHWNAFGGPQKKCECIGIKTGLCPPGALCDKGNNKCISICQNCKCWEAGPNKTEADAVPC